MPGPVSRTDKSNDPLLALTLMTIWPPSVKFNRIADKVKQDLRQAALVAAPSRKVARHSILNVSFLSAASGSTAL